MKRKQSGFTLVEIAIVLVIVGLILGGVLKGQEMISNAKVRNVIDQSTAFQTAVYAFQDRFRALPGDFSNAAASINGVSSGANGGNGDGNGFINADNDRGLFWLHLSAAGFITGNFDGQPAPNNLNCPQTTCPRNAFGSAMMFSYGRAASGATTNAHEMRLGRNVPVNVLSEIDRKTDDGAAETGSVQLDRGVNRNQCRSSGQYDISRDTQDCGGVRIL